MLQTKCAVYITFNSTCCASQNESAIDVRYSSTVQPKCLNMNCIYTHTHIHACLHIFTRTQTQIIHAQAFRHAYKHGCTHTHTHTHKIMHPLIHICKGKGKFSLEQAPKVRSGGELSLYSFFNLVARWGGWPTPRPSRLTAGKYSVLIV